MRTFLETVIFTLTRVYFFLINVAFSLINAFSPLVVVPSTSASLLLLSARQAAAAIQITSVDLIEAYIQRIIEVNPLVNAVCEEGFDDARRRAKELDLLVAKATAAVLEELAICHPLLGVPFTVKECLAVAGFRQTSGVVKNKDNIAAKDAVVVQRMKEAGAICLATTNVPELCAAGETVNALYGKTSNPYDTRRSTAGSSGGEGALIGAAASLVGIGTDIMGSIRAPAAACGVYGLMPSPGLSSMIGYFRHDLVPPPRREKILRSGPLCRYAEDLSLLLKAMSDGKAKVDEPISSLRIFYLEGIDSLLNEYTSKRMEGVVTRAVNFLERKYATTVVEVKLPLAAFTQEMFAAEFYMPGQPTIAQTVADEPINELLELIRGLFLGNSLHSPPTMMKSLLQKYSAMNETNVIKPLLRLEYLQKQVKELLGKDGILLSPTMQDIAFFHNKNVFAPMNNSYTALFNILFLPSLHCPLGLDPDSSLPVGVQVSGPANSDGRLIAIANDLEAEFGGWQQPKKSYLA